MDRNLHTKSQIIEYGVKWGLYKPSKEKKKYFEGFELDNLKGIFNLVDVALFNWSRVLIIRFDLTFENSVLMDDYMQSNKPLTKFRSDLERNLMSKKDGYGLKKGQVMFCWSREESKKEGKHHYHCFAVLNQRIIAKAYRFNGIAKGLWESIGGSFSHGWSHKVTRDDYQKQRLVIGLLSYLAKRTSDHPRLKGVKAFGVSASGTRVSAGVNHYGLHNANVNIETNTSKPLRCGVEQSERLQRQLAIVDRISAQLAVIERCS